MFRQGMIKYAQQKARGSQERGMREGRMGRDEEISVGQGLSKQVKRVKVHKRAMMG